MNWASAQPDAAMNTKRLREAFSISAVARQRLASQALLTFCTFVQWLGFGLHDNQKHCSKLLR